MSNFIFFTNFVGDEDAVPHFSRASAGIIIQQVMECSSEMENMRQQMVQMEQNVRNIIVDCCAELDTMRQRMVVIEQNYKNIIDMMGRVKD